MEKKYISAVLLLLISAVGEAQTTVPSFEVASVKPSAPDGYPSAGLFPGGRYVSNHNAVYFLILSAYHIQIHQLSGGPGWIYEDRFDVQATAGHSVRNDELRLMLQKLLAERFKLEVHRESKETAGYALALAKRGPKLEPSGTDVSAKRGFPWLVLSRNSRRITPAKTTMKEFAEWLSGVLKAPVTDETGLEGSYKFSLEYEIPDARPEQSPGAIESPSIFTAVQEQLGLKLEPRKGTMEILVIDHIERPSQN
jgi:bla regulator protein blaR1